MASLVALTACAGGFRSESAFSSRNALGRLSASSAMSAIVIRTIARALAEIAGGISESSLVLAGFVVVAAGAALALHRHHLRSEQRDDLGIPRSTKGTARVCLSPPLLGMFRSQLWLPANLPPPLRGG